MIQKINLEPVLRLESAPWTDDPALRAVFDALIRAGGRVLLVGGCVRNAVMGRKMSDYDLATTLKPDDVMLAAEKAGLKAIPTGYDHGTVTVVSHGRGFEVTTLRRDVQTDGRHADVEYTEDWGQDARRRDFTMNALYADLDGWVYDPIGGGVGDAQNGHVRFVGDPSARISEDYLRILRLFRFHAHYGRCEMDLDALVSCGKLAPHLASLSRERVTQELVKWLSAQNPIYTLNKSIEFNVLNGISNFVPDLGWMDRLISFEIGQGYVDITARLYIFLAGDVNAAREILRLSNNEIKSLDLISDLIDDDYTLPEKGYETAYRHGVMAAVRAIILGATRASHPPPSYVHDLREWRPPTCPVSGRDLMARGMAQGPEMGITLRRLEDMWIASGFAMTRDDLLGKL